MSTQSKIEWTEQTWNPATGCTKISPGCKHCYAETMANRLHAMGTPGYDNGFKLSLMPSRLSQPMNRKKPTMYFVNSMSDLFHAHVTLDFIRDVFDVIRGTPQHTYQVLTKRSMRLRRLAEHLEWPDNLWIGVSVETMHYANRVDHLRDVPAAVRFLSCEPLLGPLDQLNLTAIDWVIAGGESGPSYRPVDVNWIRGLRDNCLQTGVPFFFKQWGGRTPKQLGRELDGRTWDEYPLAKAI